MEIRVLGSCEVVSSAGNRITVGSGKQRELLALLAAHAPEVVSTDRIIDALWGDDGRDRIKTLRFHVSKLRDQLDPDRHGNVILTRPPGYGLGIEPESVDAYRFASLVTEAESLGPGDPAVVRPLLVEALGMWRGPPYLDFEYAEWARREVVRLEELRLMAIGLRIDADLGAGRTAGLVPELEALVAEHPLREGFQGQLMLALYRSGRQPDALHAFRRACDLFAELGTEPSAELMRLEEKILLQEVSLQPSTDTGDGTTRTVQNNLPQQRTSFVGREHELALGRELLEKSRLLTLVGAPGTGKTRLALRLATETIDDFPHGSFFVPLAAVTDPRLVDATIARTLGLREVQGETPIDSLNLYLHDRRALLILDNFEQVVEAAPLVGELLDAAQHLKVMVTTRSPLGLSGEQEFPIPPLCVPVSEQAADPETLSTYDAVALFVARARASDPTFTLDSNNAAAVAAITGRMDGLPLAIELAAARVKMLTPHELLNRLEQRLPMLTGGPSDVVDHHRTLRDAIAWSHELLDPDERALFRHLGILRGFNLEAAAAVTNLADTEAFDGVSSLLSKCLITRSVDLGEARFAMLETLREFALAELDAAGERQEVAKRHAHHFLHLAELSEQELIGTKQRTVMELLNRELDNTRSALRYALDAADPDLGLRIAGSIWRFWENSCQLAEGRQWLESLLADGEASDTTRAKGLSALAGLAYWQADFGEAMAQYAEALSLYRTLGDRCSEADTLLSMSMTATWNADPDTGERLAQNARSIVGERHPGDQIGRVLMAEAWALQRKKQFAEARPLWERSLAISREAGDHHLAITQLIGLAANEFHAGSRRESLRMALGALEEALDTQSDQLAVWAIDLCAAVAVLAVPEPAVRLAGAASSLRQVAGGGMRLEPLDIEDARSAATRVLAPELLDEAWEKGRAMSLEQAVDCAGEL